MDDYQSITNDGLWLEDRGKYSRYATISEGSTWVCHDCECVECDPYEDDCDCED